MFFSLYLFEFYLIFFIEACFYPEARMGLLEVGFSLFEFGRCV